MSFKWKIIRLQFSLSRLNIPVVKKPKYEPLSPDGDSPNLQKLRNSPQSMEDDPYEFSDEASINPATITNRKMRDSREEGFHNKKSPYGRMVGHK